MNSEITNNEEKNEWPKLTYWSHEGNFDGFNVSEKLTVLTIEPFTGKITLWN